MVEERRPAVGQRCPPRRWPGWCWPSSPCFISASCRERCFAWRWTRSRQSSDRGAAADRIASASASTSASRTVLRSRTTWSSDILATTEGVACRSRSCSAAAEWCGVVTVTSAVGLAASGALPCRAQTRRARAGTSGRRGLGAGPPVGPRARPPPRRAPSACRIRESTRATGSAPKARAWPRARRRPACQREPHAPGCRPIAHEVVGRRLIRLAGSGSRSLSPLNVTMSEPARRLSTTEGS